jgi:hypothetical protein
MLHPVSKEDLRAAVIHVDRHGDRDQPLGPLAALSNFLRQLHEVRNLVELLCGHLKDRTLLKRLFHAP